MRTELFFPESPLLILLCLAAGVLFAWLLYAGNKEFEKRLRLTLAILRGFLVALVCFLILGPLVRSVKTVQEKARAVVLIDNSASIAPFRAEVLRSAEAYRKKLEDAGFLVDYRFFEQRGGLPEDSVSFSAKSTDLSQQLDAVRADFEGMHLSDVFLISDGIVNKGISPVYGFYPFKIHTIAIGDTIPRNDLQLRNVSVNQVAYLGNNFPVSVDISANGMSGKTTTLTLKQGGKTIASQDVRVDNDRFFRTYTFTHTADTRGIQHYTVEIGSVEGEHSARNNRKEIFIDIIDGREKILLLALAPHPDVKAIKTALEKNENLEVDVQIASAKVDYSQLSRTPYDLVILHQLPDIHGNAAEYINGLTDSAVPLFMIAGGQSFYDGLSDVVKSVQFPKAQGQFDRVSGVYNPSFNLVNFDGDVLKLLERLPPLSVPFGDYKLSGDTEVVLFQKIGNLATQKPLLTLTKGTERKTAVMAGEGLWRWRLEEFAITGKQDVVDGLIQKVVQFLSVKEDKRKFRVYPQNPEFESGEKVVLNTEIYNDIYEQVYGQEVTLSIRGEGDQGLSYNYVHTAEKPYFEISNLPQGVYRYNASAVLNSGKEEVSGQFVVRESDIELAALTADFGLLRELSQKTTGTFETAATWPGKINELAINRPPDKLKSRDDMMELIEFKWLFFVLLLLAVTEWGVRKYKGQY